MGTQVARLASFRDLDTGWDGYDAPPPNDLALLRAQTVLLFLSALEATPHTTIAPSPEGGVTIAFKGPQDRYADVECFNDGEMLAMTSETGGEPTIWSLDSQPQSLQATLERITAFMKGTA
jgi:hypothetical protein